MKVLHEERVGGSLVTIVSAHPGTDVFANSSIMDGSVTVRFVEPLEMWEGEILEATKGNVVESE